MPWRWSALTSFGCRCNIRVRISSVCWPSWGAGPRGFGWVALILMGFPNNVTLPSCGCVSSINIWRSITICGSSTTSLIEYMGAAGTPAVFKRFTRSFTCRVMVHASISSFSRWWCFTRWGLVANCRSSSIFERFTTLTNRFQILSFAIPMITHPSAARKES